jgi:DNA polymerase-1
LGREGDGRRVSAPLEVVEELRRRGVDRGDLVALTLSPGVGAALAVDGWSLSIDAGDVADAVRLVEDALRPRWVWWSKATASALGELGVEVATCWDIAAVQRIVSGGSSADPALVWARLHDLARDTIPTGAPPDLFNQVEVDAEGRGSDDPVGDDGHLRPDWVNGGWSTTTRRLVRWAQLGWTAAGLQARRLGALPDGTRAMATARSESAAELLCAEMTLSGLPMDREVAESIIGGFVGPRPRDAAEALELRRVRDAVVLDLAPPGPEIDLRSPAQVKSLLRRVGVEVPDTRAWRLESLREDHRLIEALLAWRKAERVATTYGYAWLDGHLGADGRLRGAWSGSDGAAGRMTASAGLHNMPAAMRAAVVAETGHVFVRADLGQIEPRVLAAVSGDRALARATLDDDMYAPVAAQLGVDRATAKVAMLGAMYGQTTGHGAQALRGLRSAYPVAIGYLEDADRAGRARRPLRTWGGRLIRMGVADEGGSSERAARAQAAARGRYGRNAMVQGAAAELFKAWAATVRARVVPLDGRIVLCLHDELLVHAPAEHGDATARLVDDCLQEAAGRWAVGTGVRFTAATSVISRWSDAKV